jgi:fatty acid desaturase
MRSGLSRKQVHGTANPALKSLEDVDKSGLRDGQGRRYADFRRSLRASRSRIACDILLGWAALAVTGGAAMWMLERFPAGWPAAVPLAAGAFGYWMAYLQLFIHEAAHFNIVSNRLWNDRLANLLLGLWVGVRVENYRPIHLEHHRLHGKPTDTEHTYFSPLNGRFIFESLFGVRALKVILFRRHRLAGRRAGRANKAPVSGAGMLLCAGLVHAGVIAALVLSGHWLVAVAWVLGIGMFFPFFGALRQLLEHRDESARAEVDYSAVAHGSTTRMFEEGPFGSTFGAAGFTRHLLHHWDPSVSYTNLAQVERFLSGCEPTRELREHKTSYVRAFLALYGR